LIEADAYEPNGKTKKDFEDFMNKYDRLAIKVEDVTLSNKDTTMKKVKNQNVYVVNGDLNLSGDMKSITTPFTVIQTNGDTTIHGSIDHNIMLLTKGKIIFDGQSGGNNQDIGGIFYAQN